MSATKSTTSDNGERVTSLAAGLKNDEPRDTRGCPHDCHGTLKLTDNDRVVCDGCRCTPDGVYIPLDDAEQYDGTPSLTYNPKGLWGGNPPSDAWSLCPDTGYELHDTYDNYPYNTRLAGGYEKVYDQDEERRPNGVDETYTWDLSSSNYKKINTGHEWVSE